MAEQLALLVLAADGREVPKALCRCGCGLPAPIARRTWTLRGWRKGEPMNYRWGHGCKGLTRSAETRAKISAATKGKFLGPQHPLWKGEECSYSSLHAWVDRHKTRTGICSACGEQRKTGWANVDGLYRRILADFIELCFPCHKGLDLDRAEQERAFAGV
jgi:hypothetical protein